MTQKLYILVRTDLASMTTGRIAAQCAHAANMFVAYAQELMEDIPEDDQFTKNFKEWENQTPDHFGTTIVLNGGTEQDIWDKVEKLQEGIENSYFTGTVVDPEYPIRDGNYVWTINDVTTCAFAFPFGIEDTRLKDMELL